MTKRTFAPRTFKAWTFRSRALAGFVSATIPQPMPPEGCGIGCGAFRASRRKKEIFGPSESRGGFVFGGYGQYSFHPAGSWAVQGSGRFFFGGKTFVWQSQSFRGEGGFSARGKARAQFKSQSQRLEEIGAAKIFQEITGHLSAITCRCLEMRVASILGLPYGRDLRAGLTQAKGKAGGLEKILDENKMPGCYNLHKPLAQAERELRDAEYLALLLEE